MNNKSGIMRNLIPDGYQGLIIDQSTFHQMQWDYMYCSVAGKAKFTMEEFLEGRQEGFSFIPARNLIRRF